LEQLENRLAPAVYHVNSFQDTPAVNLGTGQDASGHVSLRSAVMAANAGHQDDTIQLGVGDYILQNGVIEVQGNIQILGQGAGQTVIETRHLDRIFAVDGGNLELDGLTLDGGAESTPIKGDVHLGNFQFTDTDPGSLIASHMVAGAASAPPPLTPLANPQEVQEPLPGTSEPIHLIGLAGGGSSAGSVDSAQETTQENHQSFWRANPESSSEQPEPEMTEEMKLSSALHKDLVILVDLNTNERTILSAKDSTTSAWQELKPEIALGGIEIIKDLRELEKSDSGQAILFVLVLGFSSFQKRDSNRREAANPIDKHDFQNWSNPPRENRRTRGPPVSNSMGIRSKMQIKRGRQRCLPCSLFS